MLYLVIGGIILVSIEALVPGFGLFGVAGVSALLWALYLWLGATVEAAMTVAVLAVACMLIAFWLISKFPDSRIGKLLTLQWRSTTDNGYVGGEPKADLLGKTGVVQSVLRPVGRAIIDGEPVDVVSDGEFFEPGTKIRVVAVTGGRVVVRRNAD